MEKSHTILKEQNNKIFPILSLFSGGGFLDLGFINNGFQINEAIEIVPYFVQAYNYGLTSYFEKSDNIFIKNGLIKHYPIKKPIDASCEIEHKRFASIHKGIIGLIGGPPCQDYSIGGKNGGIEGERGRLIYSYFRIVQLTKPSFLFFENVEGLYRTKVHRKSFDSFVKDIEDEGYYVWHDLLNVIKYGYPQDRPRIALVAFKKELVDKLIKNGFVLNQNNENLKNSEDQKLIFKWPKQKHTEPKLLDWPKKWNFGNMKSLTLNNDMYEMSVAKAFEGLSNATPNQNEYFIPRSEKFKLVEEGNTDRKSFKRLHRFRYSPTVAYGNNEVHLHPTEPRRLSVREGLRLQTVPDEYTLPKEMPLTPKFKLISNGVPTALAELIANEIRRTLLLYDSVCELNKD